MGSNCVSKLIMLYVKYDARVRPLLCAIKYFVAQRAICNAYTGYLNTFGWILLAIKFLQNGLPIGRAILPLMKMDLKTGQVMINKANMNGDENKDTVAELLSSFFEYYANFNFGKNQVSISTDIRLQEKNVSQFVNMRPHQGVWIIEHPLDKTLNVATSVKKWTAYLMQKQLANAADVVLSSDWTALTEQISEKSQTMDADPNYECSCLLLKNLRYDVKKEKILQFISRVDKPISIVLSAYKSGRHVGKAYVAMSSPQIAHNVMAELNGNLILGRPVIMQFAPIELMDDDEDDDVKQGDTDVNMRSVNTRRRIRLVGNKNEEQIEEISEAKVQQTDNKEKNIYKELVDDTPSIVNGFLMD